MIPGQFEYHRPTSVADAVGLLGKLGGEARVVAGGHSLIPMMKMRMAQPDHLIDLQDVSELKYILEDGDDLVIGAMSTQAEVIASDLLARKCPILAEAALQIADPQIRYVGTLGGNVANGDPGNDMPAIMQALDARYDLAGPNGKRQVSAREFYEGAYFTKLEDGEILTSVRFATPAAGHGWSYMKQKRKIGDYATAAAAVMLTLPGDNCTSASVSLTNVASTPLYAEAASKALIGTALDANAVDKAAEEAMAIADPASDGRGPSAYRTKVAGVMVRRAIEAARERAAG